MGRTKNLIVEDWERESHKDSLFLLEKDMENEQWYQEFLKSEAEEERKQNKKGKLAYGKIITNIKVPRYIKTVQHLRGRVEANTRSSSGYEQSLPFGEL